MNAADAMSNRDFGPLFADYKVTYGDNLEFIADTLFDTRTFTSASTVQLNFFSGTQAADLTNLDLGNMLPDKQGFLIMSIRVFPKIVQPWTQAEAASGTVQTGAANDMRLLLGTGRLQFNFLNKNYGTFPLWLLPAGGGTYPMIAVGGATAANLVTDYANNGVPDARNMYVMEQPLFLPPMSKLGVQMVWPATLTLAAGNPPIVLLFDGLMVRPVQ